jgi:hypothetical protein
MDEIINGLQSLLDDFNKLKIKERTGLTFLEIAKFPHIENVWSNIIAYYLNPCNEHNLHDLMLISLFQTANIEITMNNFNKINVYTEYRTAKGNRIDIVVIAENFILGIENKVGASLYNDLQDYSQTIDNLAGENTTKIKIVLSKYKNQTKFGFVNIVYADLIKNIKSNIGNFTDYSDTKYLIFLLDFLKNIENNLNSNTMGDNLDVINFFLNNSERVNKFIEYYNKFNASFIQKLNNVFSLIEFEEINNKYINEDKISIVNAPGRFTWEGNQLIKYKIIIHDIVIFYQIATTKSGLCSHFWLDNQNIKNILIQNGIAESEYSYHEADDEIAIKIKKQIESIIIQLK